jgi:hypothetical protein
LCSRYFERIGGTANTYFGGYAEASTVGMVPMTFSEKRTDSVNISSSGAFSIRYTGGNTPVTAITTTEKHKKGALLQLTTTSLTGGQAVMLKSNATTAYIEIDAEI